MAVSRTAIALISLVALVCHGALLLETVRLADDWSYLGWIERGEWQTIHAVQQYANLPLMEYYFEAYGFFADPGLAGRVASFCIVLASGILVYFIARESAFVEQIEALFIALISMVYPGYMMHTSLTLSVFTFCYLLFLAAALAAFLSERAWGVRHAVLRAAALLLFLLSFTANSLLVFFGPFLVLHFLVLRHAWSLSWALSLARYAWQRADYLAIPLLFWIAKGALKSIHETNPEYNSISFGLANLAGFVDFARAIGAQWWTIAATAWFPAALVAGWWFARRLVDARDSTSGPEAWAQLGFAFLLVVCGTLPYVVVGKTPSGDLEQWGTRVCLLLGLPAGVGAVALARLLVVQARIPRAAVIGALVAVVAGSCIVHQRHYTRFLAYEIESRSLIANLAAKPEARQISVFGVVTGMPSYQITQQKYSWAYVLHTALGGGLDRIAIMEGNIDPAANMGKRYTAEQIRAESADWWSRLYGMGAPTDGKQATLAIEPGPVRRGISDRKFVSRYLRTKWFEPERMDEFLRGATSIQLIPKT